MHSFRCREGIRLGVKMMTVLYIVLALLIALWLLISNGKTRKGKQIPGPRGLPFIGMGLQVTSETLHFKLEEFAGKYGDIVQIKMFGDTLVSINKAELLRKAFNDDPYNKNMNDRTYTFWATRILEESQSIGFYPHAFGGKHGDMRKGMARALHVYGDGIKQFEERITRELCRLDKVLIEKEGADFDLIAVIKRSLTNVVATLLNGEDLKDGDKDAGLFWQLDYTNEFMLNATTNAILCAFPSIVKLPGYYKTMYNDAFDAKDRILRRYFYKVRETHQRGQIRGVVDFLLHVQAKEIEAGGEIVWTDKRIKNNILETIAAAILTSLTGVANTILVLLHHPKYQDEVYNELARVIGPDRMPSVEDRPNCPFLEAIILESLRNIPPVPLMLPHACGRDIEFEGYHIPAGSLIIPNVWQIHHDKAVWEDPWTFRPERWLDESGQLLSASHPLRKHWFAFGTGRRQCSGEQFGRNRLFLYLATLLKSFKFTGTPGKYGSCDPRKGFFLATSILRSNPYLCKVEKRV